MATIVLMVKVFYTAVDNQHKVSLSIALYSPERVKIPNSCKFLFRSNLNVKEKQMNMIDIVIKNIHSPMESPSSQNRFPVAFPNAD